SEALGTPRRAFPTGPRHCGTPQRRCRKKPARLSSGRVLAVDPRAGKLHVLRRAECAPLVAAFPTLDVVRLAALLRTPLPHRGPRCVRVHRLAGLLVPEPRLAIAGAQHTPVYRPERRRP